MTLDTAESASARSTRIAMFRGGLPCPEPAPDAGAGQCGGHGDLFWAEAQPSTGVWKFAVLATSLDLEVRSLAQYRDRADAENGFDELKNQWSWGGFTTRDLKRCQHMARLITLTCNW